VSEEVPQIRSKLLEFDRAGKVVWEYQAKGGSVWAQRR
jgi:hypothetical protein